MGLMSDLKEFGQNFVLSAGTQIAENIKRRGEEDRKAVAEHVKLLRSNIAKNKALDNKLKAGLQGQLNFLTSNLPDAPVGFYKDAMSSDENFAAVKKAIQADTNKTGYWFKDMAKQYNIANPEDIYKASDKEKVKLSDIRTSKGTYAPAVGEEEEKDMSLKDIFKLGFGVPDPVESMRRAERRIVASGRGTLLEPDTQYAYGTPTRGIQPSGLPFSLRGKRTEYSGAQMAAIQETSNEKDILLIGQSERMKPILKELYDTEKKLNAERVKYKDAAQVPDALKKEIKANKKQLEEFKKKTYVDYNTRMNKVLNAISQGTMETDEIQKLLGNNASKADVLKLISVYRDQFVKLSQVKGAGAKDIVRGVPKAPEFILN
jgi:hypothetical protein